MTIYRPKIKDDENNTLSDLALDAASVDGHIMEQTGISSNTTTIPTTAQVKSYVDAVGSIIELPDQSNRITDLETGVYKLTYNGLKYLQYNGKTSPSSYPLINENGDVILFVNKVMIGSSYYWRWFYISGISGFNIIYHGYTTESSGVYGTPKNMEDLITEHQTMLYRPIQVNGTQIIANTSSSALNLIAGTNVSLTNSGGSVTIAATDKYRPIQVNGSQILADTSSTALNLSNDGNVKFAQVSGGKVKASVDIYPVGSIYMSVNSTSPASLFGGTWTQLKDRFLLGTGDIYPNGGTGGESTHTLSIDEMPSHRHQFDKTSYTNFGGGSTGAARDTGTNQAFTSYVGGGQPHNNMPPYLVVYMWKRTA